MFSPNLCHLLLFISTLRIALASPPGGAAKLIAPLHVPPVEPQDLRNGTYIVVLKHDVLPSVFDTHLNFVSLAKEATQAKGGIDLKPDIHHIYDSVILKGYSATLSQDVLELIRRRPEVQYVEQDQAGYGGDFQRNAPWVRSV